MEMPSHVSQMRPDHWLEIAAFNLYMAVQPEGGVPWDLLSHEQKERYRHMVTLAARMTDVTALRAAQERGAGAIAAHFRLALRDCEGPARRQMRFQAMDCIRAFEDQLMHGTPETDALYLQLQDEERQAHINELHAKALLEDEAEMVQRQARRDMETVTGEGRY